MPQPIDPFTELGRVAAAERIQQIADRASLVAQARNANEVIVQAENAERQARQIEQKSGEVEEDLRRKPPFSGRRGRRGSQEEAQEERPQNAAAERPVLPEDDIEHHLDVRI